MSGAGLVGSVNLCNKDQRSGLACYLALWASAVAQHGKMTICQYEMNIRKYEVM